MPPEMILKEDYNRMIDYYAIGAILYEMICGIPPFYSKKRQTLFENILTKEASFSQEFSSMSQNLITKLLEKDYTKRLGFENGMEEVKAHPFFSDIDWDKVLSKEVQPPYKPSMREINFSKEFTSIPVTFNFEEEINRNERERAMSEPRTPEQPKSSPNKENFTFGEVAGKVMKELVEKDNQVKSKLSLVNHLFKECSDLDFNSKLKKPSIFAAVQLSSQESPFEYQTEKRKKSNELMKSYKVNWRKLQDSGQNKLNAVNINSDHECTPESPSSYLKSPQKEVKFRKSLQLENLNQSRSIDGIVQTPIQIKSIKTFNSSMKFDLMSLYSKDVISERKRIDPHETNPDFEIIPEKESDFESDGDLKVDEDISKIKQVRIFHADDKAISPNYSKPITIYNLKINSKRNINRDHRNLKNERAVRTLEQIPKNKICEISQIMNTPANGSFDSTEEKESDLVCNKINVVRKSIVHSHTPKFQEASNPNYWSAKSDKSKLDEEKYTQSALKTFDRKTFIPTALIALKSESSNPFEITNESGDSRDCKSLKPQICESYQIRRKTEIQNKDKLTHFPISELKNYETNEVMCYESNTPDPKDIINSLSSPISFHNAEKYFKLSSKSKDRSNLKSPVNKANVDKTSSSLQQNSIKKAGNSKYSKYFTISKKIQCKPLLKAFNKQIITHEKSKSDNLKQDVLNKSYYSKNKLDSLHSMLKCTAQYCNESQSSSKFIDLKRNKKLNCNLSGTNSQTPTLIRLTINKVPQKKKKSKYSKSDQASKYTYSKNSNVNIIKRNVCKTKISSNKSQEGSIAGSNKPKPSVWK